MKYPKFEDVYANYTLNDLREAFSLLPVEKQYEHLAASIYYQPRLQYAAFKSEKSK